MTDKTNSNAPDLAQQHLDLARQLTQVSRLVTLGEMAAGLAHELNQPLSAIANYAMASERLLISSGTQVPEVQDALREISAQALRAGEIIRRVRQLVRPRDLNPEPTDVNNLILQLWGMIESDARLNNVDVTFDAGVDLPMALVDGIRIQQALFNLTRNAIDASATRSIGSRAVTVRTRQVNNEEIEICVEDTGPGVDPSVGSRIFEPFCTTKPEGTGLGLAVSRSIAQAHRGRLEFSPNSPVGARFVLTLPVIQQEQP